MKILFFTSFPPPSTGQTINTQFLFNGIRGRFNLRKISTSNQSILKRSSGDFNLWVLFRTFYNVFKLSFVLIFWRPNYIYTVYSSSKIGIKRDLFIVSTAKFILPKVKIIATIHSGNYGKELKGNNLKKLVSRSEKLVFQYKDQVHISNFLREDQKVQIPNSIVSGLAVSENEFRKKQEERGNTKQINLLFLGNMIKEKGYFDLLESLVLLNDSIQFNLFLVGAWYNDEDLKKVESFLLVNNLTDKVSITGSINDRSIIKQYLIDADVMILPTYYKIEAFPVSIIEAFNAGTPVIGTHHAGIPQMIKEEYNGYLVAKNSPEQIAEKITKLTNRELWTKLSTNARKEFFDKYDQAKVLDAYSNLFI